jgi:protein O-GlcNAc transferase
MWEESKFDPLEAFESMAVTNTFQFAYSGKNVRPYLERIMGKAHEYAQSAYPEFSSPLGKRKPGKYRLGFISSSLKGFMGSTWAVGWISALRKDFETHAFHLQGTEDNVTSIWRRNADHFHHVPYPASLIAQRIRELDLDGLIYTDIAMDGRTEQLALLRLARKQMASWGHPVTSGSPEIDWYLSSTLMEPADGDTHYTERLIRLPGSGLCMTINQFAPSKKSCADLGLPETGYIANVQRSFKLLPQYDWMYREICQRTGKPIVFLISGEAEGDHILEDRLTEAGVNAIVLRRISRPDYLRIIELSDVSLDPPAWNGGNTTMDALSVAKPVVSLPGEFMRGRHGLAFLNQTNIPGMIATSEGDYIDLACDRDRQFEAMKGLHFNGLFGDQAPVRAIEDLLLSEMTHAS